MPARRHPSSRRQKRAQTAQRPQPRRIWRPRHIVLLAARSLLWSALAASAGLAILAAGLPTHRPLSLPAHESRVIMLDADNRTIATRGLRHGGDISFNQLPPYVSQAVIAAEDRRFRTHSGIDFWGILRAGGANLFSGRVVQGGSTLTQQLAKNLFLKPDRTIIRKLREAMLALWLESHLSKDELLELYLNRVYFGAGTYGVAASSRRYFEKPASDLSVAEAALLAGLLKAPSRYAPSSNPAGAKARARLVLEIMLEENMITVRQAVTAYRDVERIVVPRHDTGGAPYFIDYVTSLLPDYIGVYADDIIVETTLDSALQARAERAVMQGLNTAGKDANAGQAALVSVAGNGAVLAMVGGRSYGQSQFNRAVQARRQPGSAFKPFVYLAALDAGWQPDDLILDAPVRVGSWAPGNFKDRYEGRVSLSRALAQSLNGATVRLGERVGRQRIIRVARRLGWRASLAAVPSLALGTNEITPLGLATAYVPFANGGEAVMTNPIRRIRAVSGEILYEWQDSRLGRAITPAQYERITAMLRRVVQGGTGRAAALPGRAPGGKTGTSQNHRDAWFAGFTGGRVTVVWVGNDDNTPMNRVTGGTLPAQIWRAVMTAPAPERARLR